METAAFAIEDYQNVVVLTGAGISVASGLSTYRGPGGLWERADIARIADADNLPGTLPDLWRLYNNRRKQALVAVPNAAHLCLAQLEQAFPKKRVTVLTQNVDNLHKRAGSRNVVELHGSAFETRCMNWDCALAPFHDETLYDVPPPCSRCGGFLRPNVVLFGESLREEDLLAAQAALQRCDLFLSVGTSGLVWPAARFVQIARQAGAQTLTVNVEAGHHGATAFDGVVVGKAEEVLPRLLSPPALQ